MYIFHCLAFILNNPCSNRCWSCCWLLGTAGSSSRWAHPALQARRIRSFGTRCITRPSSAQTLPATVTQTPATLTMSWRSWGLKASLRKSVWGTENSSRTTKTGSFFVLVLPNLNSIPSSCFSECLRHFRNQKNKTMKGLWKVCKSSSLIFFSDISPPSAKETVQAC